ncbi:unnamed protein product [Rotaria sp. Silwood1]|nr:unnamed protein product [Rotaria sp. Silwood1]
MEIVIEENEDLPVLRPSPTGLARHPAPLDFSDYPEIFDEWLPPPKPGDKRKLGQRYDNPPTPPSPRPPPPPIIPRKTLPLRDPNLPLIGGSLPSSPLSNNINNHRKQQQYSFNTLVPSDRLDEKEYIKSPRMIADTVDIPSMIVSPIHNSTPDLQQMKSPSVIPKNTNNITSNKSYNFSIIPIECRYYFKKTRQRCTFEAIKTHQAFLQNKYETLNNERETMLRTSFEKQVWAQVVSFIKTILEKPLENKKKGDEKRLDNLRLDQTREEAILAIKKIASSSEQQYVQELQEKFKRVLELRLQYDKLEKRFVENMPPPSLNIFDKLELHAKGLKSDDNRLKSLHERWKNILRKTKLDLTTLKTEAKIVEIEEAKKEYQDLLHKLSDQLRESYNAICYVIEIRHKHHSSPRQPPPIIPRKTLPPRNPNVPLTGGSLHASPMSNNNHEQQQQYSFNVLFPSEKENQREQHTETANLIVAQENEPSMIISPILNSTPERIIRTPSVIPKNAIIPHSSFEYAIIPIECRYYFKRMREKCTFEIIKAHQEFLENKYKTLENEREKMLYSLFPNQVRAQVVEFIKNITEKSLDRKKKDNQKRLDNLLLDQMREKATFEIKRTATSVEQEYIQNAHEKFTRTLDLKLQLDKLEKRFVENMPPPSLNSFDKLQLHAKGLKSDDIHLSSLREQWKNVLRKTKLDLTALMREAKIRELEEANKEYEQLLKKLPDHFREPYDILCHVSGTRHSQFAKRKLNFLAKRACTMNEN